MNQLSYFEIHTDDPERAMKFYGEVFEWTFQKQEGLPVPYWRIATQGARGGLLKRMGAGPAGGAPVNGFVCSMEVASYDQIHEKIMANGGIVALPKFAIPGLCWQGYYMDTEHNVFGIFHPDTNAK
jgi:predicted enzyme related to lactoylglutathione lyase